MTDLATAVQSDGTPQSIVDALTAVADPRTPPEDRLALYALLTAIKRRIDTSLGTYARKGPSVKSELTEYLVRHGEELGPTYIAWEAYDVAWPCNDEMNWADAGVQDAMAMLAKIAPDYIRHVPEHYEIRTAELGAGIAAGDPVARELHRECKNRGWRVEGGRRAALKVRDVMVPKGKAA